MNKKFVRDIFIAVCVVLIVISYFTQPSAEPNNIATIYAVPDTQFQIGAFNDFDNRRYDFMHDELGFNVWHRYTSHINGWEANKI